MRTLSCCILVVLAIVAGGAGCARHPAVARRHTQAVSPAEPTWGPTAEGLQCRLRSIKRIYPTGESPSFSISLRNQGRRVFAFPSGEQAPVHRFSIDDRWRPWPMHPPKGGKLQALGPGVEVSDLPVTLPEDARPLLAPGRHVVRLAFSFEGIEVVSNAVEIEIVGSR